MPLTLSLASEEERRGRISETSAYLLWLDFVDLASETQGFSNQTIGPQVNHDSYDVVTV